MAKSVVIRDVVATLTLLLRLVLIGKSERWANLGVGVDGCNEGVRPAGPHNVILRNTTSNPQPHNQLRIEYFLTSLSLCFPAKCFNQQIINYVSVVST